MTYSRVLLRSVESISRHTNTKFPPGHEAKLHPPPGSCNPGRVSPSCTIVPICPFLLGLLLSVEPKRSLQTQDVAFALFFGVSTIPYVSPGTCPTGHTWNFCDLAVDPLFPSSFFPMGVYHSSRGADITTVMALLTAPSSFFP